MQQLKVSPPLPFSPPRPLVPPFSLLRLVLNSNYNADIWKEFLEEPVLFLEPRKRMVLEGLINARVDHDEEEQKLATLVDLYDVLILGQCIVYCNTKRKGVNSQIVVIFLLTVYLQWIGCQKK